MTRSAAKVVTPTRTTSLRKIAAGLPDDFFREEGGRKEERRIRGRAEASSAPGR